MNAQACMRAGIGVCCYVGVVVIWGLLLPSAPAAGDKGSAEVDESALKKWGQGEIVGVADLTLAVAGPVGLSEPPLRTYKLSFTLRETLRGTYPKDTAVIASYSVRQREEPKFLAGRYLVAFSAGKGNLVLTGLEPLNEANLKQARFACSVPLGWVVREKKLVSPWASLGEKSWQAKSDGKVEVRCSVTGRPGFMAGPGVELIVEKAPPKVEFKFKNPDGDGEYKVTVKNWTEKTIEVPALLTDGKDVLWNESLVLICQGKSYALPDAKGAPDGVKAVSLKPGESVSTTIQALKLEGPAYPRGGSRIEFRFCLGERAVTQSFYYFSAHHDKIRDAIRK